MTAKEEALWNRKQPRNVAMFRMLLTGSTLDQAAEFGGVTRERARQIFFRECRRMKLADRVFGGEYGHALGMAGIRGYATEILAILDSEKAK